MVCNFNLGAQKRLMVSRILFDLFAKADQFVTLSHLFVLKLVILVSMDK